MQKCSIHFVLHLQFLHLYFLLFSKKNILGPPSVCEGLPLLPFLRLQSGRLGAEAVRPRRDTQLSQRRPEEVGLPGAIPGAEDGHEVRKAAGTGCLKVVTLVFLLLSKCAETG